MDWKIFDKFNLQQKIVGKRVFIMKKTINFIAIMLFSLSLCACDSSGNKEKYQEEQYKDIASYSQILLGEDVLQEKVLLDPDNIEDNEVFYLNNKTTSFGNYLYINSMNIDYVFSDRDEQGNYFSWQMPRDLLLLPETTRVYYLLKYNDQLICLCNNEKGNDEIIIYDMDFTIRKRKETELINPQYIYGNTLYGIAIPGELRTLRAINLDSFEINDIYSCQDDQIFRFILNGNGELILSEYPDDMRTCYYKYEDGVFMPMIETKSSTPLLYDSRGLFYLEDSDSVTQMNLMLWDGYHSRVIGEVKIDDMNEWLFGNGLPGNIIIEKDFFASIHTLAEEPFVLIQPYDSKETKRISLKNWPFTEADMSRNGETFSGVYYDNGQLINYFFSNKAGKLQTQVLDLKELQSGKAHNTGEFETTLHEEIVNTYIKLIEETLLRYRFIDASKPIRNTDGIVETDFYDDSENEKIIFIPKSTGEVYIISKQQNYNRWQVNSADLSAIQGKEWLGTYEVNYDGEGSYKIKELTEEDLSVINLVCDEISNKLSERQEIYEYDVYIGDLARGYNDGIEYIQMSLALIGDKRFYIWSEVKKNNEEYDVWMFPSPFLPLEAPESLYQNEEANEKTINNIVSMGEHVAKLRSENSACISADYDDRSFQTRLVYDTGFPFPIVEVFNYSHKNNGSFSINRLDDEHLVNITGEYVTGYHHTSWDDKRKNSLLKDIGLETVEYFDCRYENGHLTPSYEDVNKDGYIDIILSGNFQCEDIDYNVLLSQEVKRVFLYNKKQDKYIFNMGISIRSPLEEYWYPNVVNKMAKWTEEGILLP